MAPSSYIALGPGLNPFHSREEVRHDGLVAPLGVALPEQEGPRRLPLLPVQRGQGQQYRKSDTLNHVNGCKNKVAVKDKTVITSM